MLYLGQTVLLFMLHTQSALYNLLIVFSAQNTSMLQIIKSKVFWRPLPLHIILALTAITHNTRYELTYFSEKLRQLQR